MPSLAQRTYVSVHMPRVVKKLTDWSERSRRGKGSPPPILRFRWWYFFCMDGSGTASVYIVSVQVRYTLRVAPLANLDARVLYTKDHVEPSWFTLRILCTLFHQTIRLLTREEVVPQTYHFPPLYLPKLELIWSGLVGDEVYFGMVSDPARL